MTSRIHMHIAGVSFENIKTFGEGPLGVDLDFRRADGSLARWIVVAGRNGAGKTTFLQALALAVAGPSVAKSLRETYTDWIRDGADSAKSWVCFEPSSVDGFSG